MPSSWRQFRHGSRILEWLVARRASDLMLLVALLVPIGTVGYMIVGDLSPLDALYQTMITLSTVGFQDMAPTTAGKIFTIAFVGVGVGLFVLMLSSLAAFLVEGRLRQAVGRHRMKREISELEDHIIICGFGRFGQMTAVELQKRDVPFAVLDAHTERIEEAEAKGLLALQVDATEEEGLQDAGIARARGIISTLGSDAANVYVALTAKQLRPDITIVTVARDDPHAASRLRAAGADHVISPYAIGAVDLSRRILQPHVSRFLDSASGLKVTIEEIPIRTGSPISHKQLNETKLRQRFGVTVIAVVKTRQEDVLTNPPADLVLEPGDVLVAVGAPEALQELVQECASPL